MRPSEIYSSIVEIVCEEREITVEELHSKYHPHHYVEARVLAVQYLRRVGLSRDDIAKEILKHKGITNPSQDEIKQKAKNVDKLFCSYSTYCLNSDAFCGYSQTIKERCTEKYPELFSRGSKSKYF